ncbi:ileal sodium/bile acid cotransporter-like [Amphiura filiformis]|uniref:ileal sodium/bile acid cotransporter-like n=1 Tax=Amphiura filiformis TaxID=82378 RepID=UPI003B21DB10
MASSKGLFVTIATIIFLINIHTASSVGNVTFSYWRRETYVQERTQADVYVNISLTDGAEKAHLVLFSPDEETYKIVANESVNLAVEELGKSATLIHKFTVAGKKLGVAQVYVRGSIDGEKFEEYYTNYLIKVMVWSPPYKELVDWFLIAWVSLTYISMGVKIDLKLVWKQLKTPWPVFIGFLCQFILMPLTAFALAMVLQLDTFSAIGLITDGAAPGGWSSNVLSILFGLDFVLSLTMTTCSTLVAIGSMPFNLWLYGTPFLNEELGIIVLPFQVLIMQLGLLLIPVILGMLIGYFLPKVGKYVAMGLKPLSIALIVLSIGLGIPVKYYAFLASWEIYLAGLLLPVVGGGLGLGISLICRLSWKQAMTVALETGLQNALLATTMLALAFRPPEKDLMARVPLLISILSLGECLLAYIAKTIYDLVKGRRSSGDPEDDVKELTPIDEEKADVNHNEPADGETNDTKDMSMQTSP